MARLTFLTTVATAILAMAPGAVMALPLGSSSEQKVFELNDGSVHDEFATTRPLVNTHDLQNLINEQDLRKEAENLYEIAKISQKDGEYDHPTRVIGSAGHNRTIEYLVEELRALDYYDVTTQSFTAVSGRVRNYTLEIDGHDLTKHAFAFKLTPATHGTDSDKPERVTAPLAVAKDFGCLPSNYGPNIKGSIVFVERGKCPFGDKSELAGLAGAKAVLIFDKTNPAEPVEGTLSSILTNEIASLGVAYNDVKEYIDQLSSNSPSLEATAYVDASVDMVNTLNVVAETRSGDKNNVVMLGAHSDSVSDGPGINDDGSGTISVLNVARALTEFNVTNAVRFAWWAAEEEGLLGSNYYAVNLTPEENRKIRLFMDYDMMASPNFAYQVYDAAANPRSPEGSADLQKLYQDYYIDQGLNYTLIPFDGRSDYQGFFDNGVPTGGIATGAEVLKTAEEAEMFGGTAGIAFDPCYHQLCDDLSNVHYDAWIVNTKLIAHSVATYAKSFEGFPQRHSSSASGVSTMQYRGHHLVY